MHTGRNYSFAEVIIWTRRDIYVLLATSALPTAAYILLGWRWLAIPWLPVALLGTAVAFVVGFKNNASYDRLWEARRIWGAIVNASRVWAMMVSDYVTARHAREAISENDLRTTRRVLLMRHLAWLTALRYQLREPRAWEAVHHSHNAEYKNKWFVVDEHANKLSDAVAPYLSKSEYEHIQRTTNKAAQILALQSAHLRELLEGGLIEDFRHMELERVLAELYTQQGGSERIKNFPYPRQYATLNTWFIRIFIVLVPLGMIQEFEKLGSHMTWFAIPFSALAGWVFTTMERIGESSESPFEGSANDVPITAISRSIEIDLREMLGESDVLKPLTPSHNILT